jgi:SAM-dependent methyltransferase
VEFDKLEDINTRPAPFQFYTAEALWTDEHTSKKMLAFHLNESVDLASRKSAFIDRSTAWIVSRFNVKGNTSIADFGCGPGLYAIRLAKEKANVIGIDFSANSIRYAEKAADRQGLKVEYHHQNYLEFDTEKQFDLIIMIFCDYCALSPEQRKTILDKYTIIEENRTRVVYNWLQHFSRESLEKEFERGGFTVEDFYSDVCGTPFSEDSPDMAIVSKKP